MKYFLHDTGAFEDEKIHELFMSYGYEGLGLFYSILEKLAKQEKPIKTSVLKSQLFVGKKLEKCWKFMESLEIISSNNGETFNENLLKFSEKYLIKKEKTKEKVSQWRKNKADTKDVTSYNNECNPNIIKDNISKVNESKESEFSKNKFPINIPGKKVKENPDLKNLPPEEEKEKSSGQKEKDHEIIYPFNSEIFLSAWKNWLDYRREIKKAYKSKKSEQAALKQLSEFDEEFSIKLIERSMAAGYQGLVYENTKQEFSNYGKHSKEKLGATVDSYINRKYGSGSTQG